MYLSPAPSSAFVSSASGLGAAAAVARADIQARASIRCQLHNPKSSLKPTLAMRQRGLQTQQLA